MIKITPSVEYLILDDRNMQDIVLVGLQWPVIAYYCHDLSDPIAGFAQVLENLESPGI